MSGFTMTEERVYTVPEVAKILRVDARTVRNMIHRRKLQAFQVGSEYRIRKSALEELMQGRRDTEKDTEDGA